MKQSNSPEPICPLTTVPCSLLQETPTFKSLAEHGKSWIFTSGKLIPAHRFTSIHINIIGKTRARRGVCKKSFAALHQIRSPACERRALD
jgi:hypothetical protein